MYKQSLFVTSVILLLFFLVGSCVSSDVETKCTPKSRFKFYCNTCWCSEEGTIRICTKKYCPEDIFNMDGSLKSLPNVYQKMKNIGKGVTDPAETIV